MEAFMVSPLNRGTNWVDLLPKELQAEIFKMIPGKQKGDLAETFAFLKGYFLSAPLSSLSDKAIEKRMQVEKEALRALKTTRNLMLEDKTKLEAQIKQLENPGFFLKIYSSFTGTKLSDLQDQLQQQKKLVDDIEQKAAILAKDITETDRILNNPRLEDLVGGTESYQTLPELLRDYEFEQWRTNLDATYLRVPIMRYRSRDREILIIRFRNRSTLQNEFAYVIQDGPTLVCCSDSYSIRSLLDVGIKTTLKTPDGKSTESFRTLQKFIRDKQLGDLTIE
jgi:hypothetical protein